MSKYVLQRYQIYNNINYYLDSTESIYMNQNGIDMLVVYRLRYQTTRPSFVRLQDLRGSTPIAVNTIQLLDQCRPGAHVYWQFDKEPKSSIMDENIK